MSSSATMNQLDSQQQQQHAFGININSNLSAGNATNTIVDFSVGSMPANYGYDESFSNENEDDESNEESSQHKPRILIMGLRRYKYKKLKDLNWIVKKIISYFEEVARHLSKMLFFTKWSPPTHSS